MSGRVFWLSLLVYGAFGAGFALVSVLKILERQPGPAAASGAGAIYALFRAAMVLRHARHLRP